MKMRSYGLGVTIYLLLLANWITPRRAIAQRQAIHDVANYIPVVIAVTDSFPYRGADAVIVRRVGASDQDVIAVRRGKADVQRLALAVRTLQVVRARFGNEPARDLIVRVPQVARAQHGLRQAAYWADILSKVEAKELPGFGNVPFVRVYLPRQE